MHKFRLVLLLAGLSLFAANFGYAASAEDAATVTSTQQSCEELKHSGASSEVLAQRGCCSWHQGVCGCNSGRVVCCDNTYSPSCTCNQEDPITLQN
jgi:hypothetical protein